MNDVITQIIDDQENTIVYLTAELASLRTRHTELRELLSEAKTLADCIVKDAYRNNEASCYADALSELVNKLWSAA